MYTGYSAIKDIVDAEVLVKFVSLLCSVRLFCDDKQNEIEYAHSLMEYFVKTFKILCKRENMSHNVNGLLHIIDDVREHGKLDHFSAFKFESYIFHIKKMIRKSSHPLEQIHNRLVERGTPNLYQIPMKLMIPSLSCLNIQKGLLSPPCHVVDNIQEP